MLADFAGAARGTLFDLGAGVGAIALVMLARKFVTRAVLVESDPDACELAKRNAIANDADAAVVCEDVIAFARAHRGEAALVTCNPPYFEPGSGKAPAAASSARARVGALDHFLRATREVLGRRGRACFVYPATDLARVLADFRAVSLEPKRLRFVHSNASEAARVVLVEARASKPGGLVVMPPLIEREGATYTFEAAKILGVDQRAPQSRSR